MKILLLLVSAILSVALALPPTRPINCVSSCKCEDQLPNILNVVNCKGPLTINSTLFDHLDRKTINVIRFSNVTIERIQEDAFKRLPSLEDVIIERASIGSIDVNAFNNTVKKVKFADCGFEENPRLSSEKMEELHFGNCKLDVIPPLDDLFSLTFLNLSGNYINEIPVTAFAELFDLERLDLSNNELSRVPANVFVNNNELSSLYLDNNPLKMFFLNTSNSLEMLSLKNCFLTTFDDKSAQRLTSLNELNLMNNRISNLKGLAYMKDLQIINVANNNLSKLENNIFSNNPKLQKVILDGNKLETLPNFTLPNGQFEIYDFSCENCGLTMVHPNAFKAMPLLINLNLSHNGLTFVQDMLVYLKSLLILDLSYNKIPTLTGSFDKNSNLESLNLAGNPLLELNPENFAFNKAINKIDASHCKLKKLWSNNATTLKSLKKLYLASNQLLTLTVSDFAIVPHLSIIDLSDNAFMFSDELCRTINILEAREVTLVDNSKTSDDLGQLIDDVDNFVPNGWNKLRKDNCQDISNDIQDTDDETENLENDKEDIYDFGKAFGDIKKDLAAARAKISDEDDDEYYNYEDLDYKSDEVEDEDEDEDDDDKPTVGATEENVNLARVSYILSITSVFVLTAMAVLIMVVVITLYVLRRNNSFNMHKANLPRIKIIPRLTSQFEKKHSGSIYRPLSEDLSGPPTPKMSRYEFSATPAVHSNP